MIDSCDCDCVSGLTQSQSQPHSVCPADDRLHKRSSLLSTCLKHCLRTSTCVWLLTCQITLAPQRLFQIQSPRSRLWTRGLSSDICLILARTASKSPHLGIQNRYSSWCNRHLAEGSVRTEDPSACRRVCLERPVATSTQEVDRPWRRTCSCRWSKFAVAYSPLGSSVRVGLVSGHPWGALRSNPGVFLEFCDSNAMIFDHMQLICGDRLFSVHMILADAFVALNLSAVAWALYEWLSNVHTHLITQLVQPWFGSKAFWTWT